MVHFDLVQIVRKTSSCAMDDPKLIELVREHESIFDPKNCQYKDLNVRDNVWAEIAELMEQPAEECRNRWKNIRDTYMRRKRKNKRLPTGSARSKSFRKWHLEENLKFLNSVEYERESLTNTEMPETKNKRTDDDNQQDRSIIEDNDINNSDADAEPVAGVNIIEKEKKPACKKINSEIKPTPADVVDFLLTKNSEHGSKLLLALLNEKKSEEHPTKMFFNSMAASVMKFSPENQVRVRNKICQIVSETELYEIVTKKTTSSMSENSLDSFFNN